MKIYTLLGTALLAAATLPAASLAQTDVCPSLTSLVEAALPPEVGDPAAMERLLVPGRDPARFTMTFDRCRALSGVGSSCTAITSRECHDGCDSDSAPHGGDCTYRLEAGTALRTRGGQGRYKYINGARTFDRARDGSNDVADDVALRNAKSAAAAFGLRGEEIDPASERVLSLAMFAGSDSDPRVTQIRAEAHVRFARQIDGTPVFGSKFLAAVDKHGQVARLHMNWPEFRLLPGLSSQGTLPRNAVRQELVRQLVEAGACGTWAGVDAKIAYVPRTRLADAADGEADDRTGSDRAIEDYVPAVVLHATPQFDASRNQLASSVMIAASALLGPGADVGPSSVPPSKTAPPRAPGRESLTDDAAVR